MSKWIAWLPAVICLVVIFGFSAQSGSVSNHLSGELTHEIAANTNVMSQTTGRNMIELNLIVRKMAHFALYLSLGMAVMSALADTGMSRKRAFFAGISICILSAFSDELHQSFVPGRDARWQDVLIDSSGAAAGLVLYQLWKAVKCYRKSMKRVSDETSF